MIQARFGTAYWAAYLGLLLTYIPLFGLFLPVHVAQVSHDPLTDQSVIVLIGSIVASVAGVLAGRLSDIVFARTGSRRFMLWSGLVIIGISYVQFVRAESIMGLVLAIIVLQVGINVILAGINALFAVHVPPQDKAHLASILNLGLPVANLGLILLGGEAGSNMEAGLFAIGGLASVLFLPLLLWRAQSSSTPTAHDQRPAHPVYAAIPVQAIWAAVFTARFFVQLSSALLFTFVQPYLAANLGEAEAAAQTLWHMVALAAIVSLPVALGAARLAAWRINPMTLLQIAALALAAAMGLLTIAPTALVITISYAIFMAALVSYQAIETAIVAQWLSHSPQVATHLGVMNMANTVPGILIPAFLLTVGGPAADSLFKAFAMTSVGGCMAVVLLGYAKARLGQVRDAMPV